MVSATEAKDPVKSRAGKAGMLARWGTPRIVRLDDFPPEERAAIIAAIDARRAARKAAAAAGLAIDEGSST